MSQVLGPENMSARSSNTNPLRCNRFVLANDERIRVLEQRISVCDIQHQYVLKIHYHNMLGF